MLFAKIMDECRADAQRHGIEKKLEELVEDLERKQCDDTFEKSPKPFMVRQSFGGRAGRLLGHKLFTKINGESHAVIMLLRYMVYDADQYAQTVISDPQGFYDKKFKGEMDCFEAEKLDDYVRSRLKRPPEVEKPRITHVDPLGSFLYSPVSQGTDRPDCIICESANWIDAVFSADIEDLLPRVRDALEVIHGAGADGNGEVLSYPVPKSGNRSELTSEGASGEYVVFYQWITEHVKNDTGEEVDENTLYICDVGRKGSNPKGVIPAEDLCRAKEYYYRAYPAYMLSDDKLWIRQEKERYGNFALSKEESEVLNIPEGEPNVPFPLFVNGRAGSGKSTVLQYLYAEYFVRFNKLRSNEFLPPAYFACSAELLERAKEVVGGILRNNPDYNFSESEWKLLVRPQDGGETAFTASFRVYRDYLISLIPVDKLGRFAKAAQIVKEGRVDTDPSFVDYARFVQLWEQKFSDHDRKMCGPGLSWHLIRTYIKGWSVVSPVSTVDDLAAMLLSENGNEELVKSGVHKLIFEKVWLEWYKDLTAPDMGLPEYWDDQDLVRYVLANGYLQALDKKSVGVFCDEAQDFTRIELKSLLAMSVYSDRKIEGYQLKALPFVFAGDEFQTLNPTGFRWDVMQTSFVESLLEGLCPSVKDPYVNFKDLKHNYRSKYNIVKLGNSVQLNRALAFKLGELGPQKPWRKSAANAGKPVFYFDEGVEDLWRAFQELVADKAIVLPCLENQENAYLKAHPILRSHVEERPDGTTNPPVFSVVSAKGLDFDHVLAYGFGEAFINDLPEEHLESSGTRMALGYFLNRLYVAVTRPKEQLLIVDGREGFDRLWKSYLSVDDLLERYKGMFGKDGLIDDWRENVGIGLNDGKEMTEPLVKWEADGGDNSAANCLSSDYKYDPLDTARKYETSGMRERNYKLMLYASRWYRRCKDDIEQHAKDANRCEAFANLFSGKQREAARLFSLVNDYKRACECWWSLRPFDCDSLARAPLSAVDEYPHRFRFEVARACSDGGTLAAEVGVIKKMVDGIDIDGENLGSDEWKSIVRDVVKNVLKDRNLDANAADVVCDAAERRLYKVDPAFFERLVRAKLYSQSLRLYAAGRFNPHDIAPESYKKACFYSKDIPVMLEYAPNERNEEDNRHIVDRYLVDPPGKSRLIDDIGRKIVIDAFASTVGLADMWYELRQIRDVGYLRVLADRIGGKIARRSLYQAAVVLKYESLRHGEALNSIAAEGGDLIGRYGAKFVVRLLARIAFAPSGGDQPHWSKIRMFIDTSRILDPSAYAFSDELSEEEFRVAFTKYENKLLVRFPQYRDTMRNSWRNVGYTWDSLRDDILTKDRLSVDSVYKYGEKDVGLEGGKGQVGILSDGDRPRPEGASNQLAAEGEIPVVVKTPPQGAVKITIGLGTFKATYYRRTKRLEFVVRVDDDDAAWSIGTDGLSIDHEPLGFVQEMQIPGVPFLLTCQGESVDFYDAESGCHIIVKFS